MFSFFRAFGRLHRFQILAALTLVYLLGFLLTRIGLLFWFADWRQLGLVDFLNVLQVGLRYEIGRAHV